MSFIKNMNYEERRNFRTAIISIVLMVFIFAVEAWAYCEMNMLDYTWKMSGKSVLITVITTFYVVLIGMVLAYLYGCAPSGWRIAKEKMSYKGDSIVIMPLGIWFICAYFKFFIRIFVAVFWGVMTFPGYLLGSKYPKLYNRKMCGICTIIVLVVIRMSVFTFDVILGPNPLSEEEQMQINYEKQMEMNSYFVPTTE